MNERRPNARQPLRPTRDPHFEAVLTRNEGRNGVDRLVPRLHSSAAETRGFGTSSAKLERRERQDSLSRVDLPLKSSYSPTALLSDRDATFTYQATPAGCSITLTSALLVARQLTQRRLTQLAVARRQQELWNTRQDGAIECTVRTDCHYQEEARQPVQAGAEQRFV